MARFIRHSFFRQGWIRSLENRIPEVEAAIRGILADVTQRYKAAERDAPDESEDEELLEGYQDYLESFVDQFQEAEDTVKVSLGVLLVLIFSHVEGGLKGIWSSTRARELPKKPNFPELVNQFATVSIDLRTVTGYPWIETINRLNNAFKHNSGELKERVRLPDGTVLEMGLIDFQTLPYQVMAREATAFLLAVDNAAASPAAPRTTPKIVAEEHADGSLFIRWEPPVRFGGKGKMPHPLELWLQDDGGTCEEQKFAFRLVETRQEFTMSRTGNGPGPVHVRARYLNTRYEAGPFSDAVSMVFS